MSSFWLSLAFVNSSIFMKNWRIFRIFHNPHQKERVCTFYVYIKCINQLLLQNNLSNWKMCLGIVIFCIPVVIVLIVIVGAGVFSRYQVSFSNYHCPNFVS